MRVTYNGEFVMKVHMLPLFVVNDDGSGDMVLAVDGIETVRGFRDDLTAQARSGLLEKKETIFEQVIEKVLSIASRMGISRVYAEKFSNTPWIREAFGRLPEIFLHVDRLIKLDELEDVFSLSQTMSRDMQMPPPRDIFMEIQMKNTSLQPVLTHRMAGIKPFALLRGNPEDGIPMKRVMGI
jgi:hypothetical protein